MAPEPVFGPPPGRATRRRLALGAAGMAALAAAAVALPAVWVHGSARGRLFTPAEVPEAPVTLVLGAGVYPDGRPTPFLRARLDVARELYAAGRTRVIVVSGDNRTPQYDEPAAMRRYLLATGVPDRHIVSDVSGWDTYDSCARAKRIFGVDRLVVVSQSYHLPRALAICRALGIDAVGVGDETMRDAAPGVWREGELRELFANVKAVFDVVSRRDPELGPPDPSVRDALRSG